MDMYKRQLLAGVGLLALGAGAPLAAASAQRVAIAVPGPGNLLFLPITLASKIGADVAEGGLWHCH